MRAPFFRVNAFVDQTLDSKLRAGNPAAVVILSAAQNADLDDHQRQNLASELKLSETAFVARTQDYDTVSGEQIFELRWFTPVAEVDLCGHATLAAAQALTESGWCTVGQRIPFRTLYSGMLYVDTHQDSSNSSPPFRMQFPLNRERLDFMDVEKPVLLCGLGVTDQQISTIFRSRFDIVVVLRHTQYVEELKPKVSVLIELDTRGIIVAAKGNDASTTFVSRFFAPRLGIDEDPVTGSAHCALAPLFLEEGQSGTARQLSIRGGLLLLTRRDGILEIAGWTQVVIRGEITF